MGAGGTYTCDSYSVPYCAHDEIKNKCCMCGGGSPPVELTHVPSSAPTTTSVPSSSPSAIPGCTDAKLEGNWATYECDQFDTVGTEYCQHEEINTKCCFCGGGEDERMSIRKVTNTTKAKGNNKVQSTVKVIMKKKLKEVDIELLFTLTYPDGNVVEKTLIETTNTKGVATFKYKYSPTDDAKAGFVSATRPGFKYFKNGNKRENGCRWFTSDCPTIVL